MSHLSMQAGIAALVGLAVAAVAVLTGVPDLAPLLGWVVASAVFLTWAWRRAWPADPGRTRALARHEDRSRRLVDVLIITATFLSLVLVVFALVRSQQKDLVGSVAAILAVIGVVAAWALVNTVYAFKYARMYYLDDHHRFDFDQDEERPTATSPSRRSRSGWPTARAASRSRRPRRAASPWATRSCPTSSAPSWWRSRSTSSPGSRRADEGLLLPESGDEEGHHPTGVVVRVARRERHQVADRPEELVGGHLRDDVTGSACGASRSARTGTRRSTNRVCSAVNPAASPSHTRASPCFVPRKSTNSCTQRRTAVKRRRLRREQRGSGRRQAVDLVAVDGHDEVRPRREVPVQGGDADPRGRCHLAHRSAHAGPREDLGRGVEEGLSVALHVSTPGRLGNGGRSGDGRRHAPILPCPALGGTCSVSSCETDQRSVSFGGSDPSAPFERPPCPDQRHRPRPQHPPRPAPRARPRHRPRGAGHRTDDGTDLP